MAHGIFWTNTTLQTNVYIYTIWSLIKMFILNKQNRVLLGFEISVNEIRFNCVRPSCEMLHSCRTPWGYSGSIEITRPYWHFVLNPTNWHEFVLFVILFSFLRNIFVDCGTGAVWPSFDRRRLQWTFIFVRWTDKQMKMLYIIYSRLMDVQLEELIYSSQKALHLNILMRTSQIEYTQRALRIRSITLVKYRMAM